MGIVNPLHLAFIALVALIVLGPKRLPELARSLGEGMRHFRESLETGSHADHDEVAAAAMVQPQSPQAVVAPEHDPGAPSAHVPDQSSPGPADSTAPWAPGPDPSAAGVADPAAPWAPGPDGSEPALGDSAAPSASAAAAPAPRGPGGTGRAAQPATSPSVASLS